MFVYMCVFKFFSETTEPIKAKVYGESPWDRGGKFTQMIQVISCSSLCQPRGRGIFSRDFITNLTTHYRAFSWAL